MKYQFWNVEMSQIINDMSSHGLSGTFVVSMTNKGQAISIYHKTPLVKSGVLDWFHYSPEEVEILAHNLARVKTLEQINDEKEEQLRMEWIEQKNRRAIELFLRGNRLTLK